MKIAAIERLAMLDFGDLRKHDALNVDGAERFSSATFRSSIFADLRTSSYTPPSDTLHR